ncbi:MAG TPA: hypothetical protein DEB24_05685 [Coriobacteriia bacterium]|nr:hypothetical protein [Coriobacteriia bacterium]
MKKYEEDIIRVAWNKRVSSLPVDIQKQLSDYNSKREMTDELVFIKKKRPKIEEGDVFVVQPRKGLYYYGRVLKAHVDVRFHRNENYKWRDSVVVCIYRSRTKDLSLRDFNPTYENLLVRPRYLTSKSFNSGYLFVLGNVPLTDEEKQLDYGFFSTTFWIMTDVYGNLIETTPRFIGMSALGNFGALARELKIEFIIDPSLLDLGGLSPKGSSSDASANYQDTVIAGDSDGIAERECVLHIKARLAPFDRGDLYEDPLEDKLSELGLGLIQGAGTAVTKDGEPESCDIEIELKNDNAGSIDLLRNLISSLSLPKGSALLGPGQNHLDLGSLEGLALYLNGTDLADGVYRDYDANDVNASAAELLGSIGKRYSSWNGPSETALYFYGESYSKMLVALKPLIDNHPLCQRCRVEQIA